jgi:hypothetical protein
MGRLTHDQRADLHSLKTARANRAAAAEQAAQPTTRSDRDESCLFDLTAGGGA